MGKYEQSDRSDLPPGDEIVENPLARFSQGSSSQARTPMRRDSRDRLLQTCSSLGSSYEAAVRHEARRNRDQRGSRLRDGYGREQGTPSRHAHGGSLGLLTSKSERPCSLCDFTSGIRAGLIAALSINSLFCPQFRHVKARTSGCRN